MVTAATPGIRQRRGERLGDGFHGRTHDTFAALRVRNYRLFFTGQAISLVGTWMQSVRSPSRSVVHRGRLRRSGVAGCAAG